MEERRNLTGTVVVALRKLAVLVAVMTVTGCNSGSDKTLDTSKDEGAINVLLIELADLSGPGALSERLFDKPTMPKPADLAKYKKFRYNVTEWQIDGTSAKFKVEVKDQQDAVLATQDWTATKASGSWKLQAAPLP